VRRIPFLPKEYSLRWFKTERYRPRFLSLDGQEAEHGRISWAGISHDANDDGYPDFWVANDLGKLRLYINRAGRAFELTNHAQSLHHGAWMTFAAGDYNGDLKEDLFVGNIGGNPLFNPAHGLCKKWYHPQVITFRGPAIKNLFRKREFPCKKSPSNTTFMDGRFF